MNTPEARKRIADAWGELPAKLGMIKCRKCHGIDWRFDLVNVRTGDTAKQSNSETKLRIWAETHGWVIPNAPATPPSPHKGNP